MNISISKVKIIVMIPFGHLEKIRNEICKLGAGVIGNYTYCSTSSECIGTFIPNDHANPYIGNNNKLEKVKEEKLEVVCDINKVKKIISRLKEIHPYEEPSIDIIPLIDENYFEEEF